MATDLILNASGDLYLIGNKLTLWDTEEEAVSQRLTIALLKNKGEWFLDILEGIPYLQKIVSKKGSKTLADSLIKKEILGTVGIELITDFSSTLDKKLRKYTVNFDAITITGSVISIRGLNIFGGV